MRKFWDGLTSFVKWLVRVAIAVAVVFLLGAAIAALYKESAPDMYMWFAQTIQNIF